MTPQDRKAVNAHMYNLANEIRSATQGYSMLRQMIRDNNTANEISEIAYRADELARTSFGITSELRRICGAARRIVERIERIKDKGT